jgi:hypothetical protein
VRPPDGDPLLLVGAAGITASIQLGGSAELHRPEGDAGTLQVWRVGEDCVLEHELLDNLDVSIHAMYVAVLGGEPVVVAMADRSQVGDESSSDQFERVTTKFYGLFWASPGGEPVVRLEEGAGPPNSARSRWPRRPAGRACSASSTRTIWRRGISAGSTSATRP